MLTPVQYKHRPHDHLELGWWHWQKIPLLSEALLKGQFYWDSCMNAEVPKGHTLLNRISKQEPTAHNEKKSDTVKGYILICWKDRQ